MQFRLIFNALVKTRNARTFLLLIIWQTFINLHLDITIFKIIYPIKGLLVSWMNIWLCGVHKWIYESSKESAVLITSQSCCKGL